MKSTASKPKRVRLNDTKVRDLKPAAERYALADTEVVGLQVRVTPNGVKSYSVRCRLADGKRVGVTLGVGGDGGLTVEEARDMARQHIAEMRKGQNPNADKREAKRLELEEKVSTLGAFIEKEYAPKYLSRCKSGDETLQRLKACFEGAFWKTHLKDITPAMVEHWMQGRVAEGRANATINRDVTCLKGVLTKAVRWGFLDVHPLHKKIDHLPEDRDKEPRYLTPPEEKRLMKALNVRQWKQRKKRRSHNEFCAERDYEPWPSLDGRAYTDYLKPMVELSLNTGLRQNEAFSLEWSDVDFGLERIAVRGVVAKTGKTRYVPLNEKALEVLKTWRAESEGDGLVFPSPNGGGKITNVQTAWERILKATKIKNFVWHNLRSTFASRLVQSGVDLYVVMKLLGHKNISTTQRYSSLAPDQERAAVARIVRPANVIPFGPPKDDREAVETETAR